MSEWKLVAQVTGKDYGEDCLVANRDGFWRKAMIGSDGKFYTEDGSQPIDVIPRFFMYPPSVPKLPPNE